MDLTLFKKSIAAATPPSELTVYLEALWHDGKGNWEHSHNLVQDLEDKTASWIHGYLHRKEGDAWNADYWYQKAGRKRPEVSPGEEWEKLVEYCLQQQDRPRT